MLRAFSAAPLGAARFLLLLNRLRQLEFQKERRFMKSAVSARSSRLCTIVLVWVLPLIGTALHAQSLRAVAANSANSAVYDVNFVAGAGGSISVINADQSVHTKIVSLAFLTNQGTLALDVLAADQTRNELLRYPGPLPDEPSAAIVLWEPSRGVAGPNPLGLAGPIAPNGLSLDSAQNLFVVSSTPGASLQASLWVFPRNSAGPLSGGFDLPRLVDSDFGGVQMRELEETVVAFVAVGPIGIDDLLVAAASPASVLVYSAAQIQAVLGGGGEVDPLELISSGEFSGAAPAGLDFWPPDNSLLISTTGGNILRYDPSSGGFLANFATGLGNGKFKVRTGIEFGQPRAIVANRNGGEILKLGPPPSVGANVPLASVTAGVQSPQGLTLTNVGLDDAVDCLEANGGCDGLGGVLTHTVRNTANGVAGTILQDPCIVQRDPRVTGGVCDGSSLNLADVCPGFEAVTIPGHICGSAGDQGAFAVVQAYAPDINLSNGIFVSEAFAEAILPSPVAACPQTLLGWAPVPSIEAPSVAGNEFEEFTGFCRSSGRLGRSGSYFIIAALNLDGLPGATETQKLALFIDQKYARIEQVIASSSIERRFARTLGTCFADSRRHFSRGRYANALGQLIACDSLVATNPGAFTSTAASPNPSGEIRGRTANAYLRIAVNLLHQSPPSDWPPGG
jgi:hypothetical protein